MAVSSTLMTIVAKRRERIAELAQQYDVDTLAATLTPSTRSLAKALSAPASGFILECKKASPSKGLIRDDFHPVNIAKTYSRYAAAISVLTEPDYFQGDFAYLSAVSASVSIPVLCKDFIVEPLQVLLARHFGADAILLMLSVLDDASYQQLARLAERYQLDVLTEVSTPEEMQRAADLGAKIIGINNRNLHDLTIDIQRSRKLSQFAPAGALLVAESGYSDHASVRATAPFVDGFLVGSALTGQACIDQACRELIYGQHKVCGLTRPSDAMVVRASGAAYGGLIFVPQSPRAVTLAQAAALIACEPELAFVGVFADSPLQYVIDTATELGLHAVQLHGHEDIDYIAQLRQQLPRGIEIWQACAVEAPLQLPDSRCDRYLLDHGAGGTGQAFDWQLLDQLSAHQRRQCILAGGLGLENLADAQATGLTRFDFNSQLEHSKGVKDAGKIIQLFQHIRHYGKHTS
ncbi:bifunctional indole-3-glycerol-phosphate synthase TrpC/phosphoribosylanthranilate isomerase TrpF [Pseudidiomarina sediminum]|uniref:bifunctional indole-3-glycerol-phosphate synthase TrpC/phosphoribosylanthranilate isomerase TrpF n=1 Tax=Pseudidiomarina sediminum TaxID=431675 RepID=UPI0030B897E6